MVIERDGQPAGLVASMTPLQTTESDGSKRPTDVSLIERAAGFAPVNPAADSLIGKTLRDGLRLPGAGLTMTPAMPSNPAGVLSDDRVFYADAATDTDVVAGATPDGAAVYYQFRSPESPERLDLDFTLPDRAALRPTKDGLGGIEVVRDGKVIASVRAPVARDAQGTAVPATYSIAGDRVTATIEHAGGDYAYPILLDPVVDQQLWWPEAPSGNVYGWFHVTPRPDLHFASTNGAWGKGLYSSVGGSRWYAMGSYGEWRYPMPGTSFLYRMTFSFERQGTNSPYQAVCTTVGLVNPGGVDNNARWSAFANGQNYGGGTGPRTRCNDYNDQFLGRATDTCVMNGCAVPSSHQPNYAVFSQWTYGDSPRDSWNVAYLGGAVAYLSDPEAPSISGGPDSEIGDPNATWRVYYQDPGLGLRWITIDSPDNPGWSERYGPDDLGCAGVAWWPCTNAWQGRELSYGNLPPGRQTIRVRAEDAGGKVAERNFPVFVATTSWQYGGPDRRVNTLEEAVAASEAIATSEDPERTYEGLVPEDRAFVCRDDIPDEGYPSTCTDQALDENATPPPPDEADGPVDLVDPGGSGSTAGSSSAGNVRTINPTGNGPWATVRNRGGHYAIGNAGDGDQIVTGGRKGQWYAGRVSGGNGNYRLGCGWIQSPNTVPTDESNATGCTTSSWPQAQSFAKRVNCRSCGRTSGKFRPQPGTALCANLSSLFNRSSKTCVREIDADISDRLIGWRYITRDGGWVMVGIADRANSYGKWGFVRRSDIPAGKIRRGYYP